MSAHVDAGALPVTSVTSVTSVVDRVRRGLPDLTQAERRVARTVIAGYPVSALGTVAGLASSAGTSSASVVRLVQKLGFEGYSQFQSAVRDELANRTSGPADRMDDSWAAPGSLAHVAAAAARTVASISATVPQSEFDAAVALLGDPSRPLTFIGGRATGLLAEHAQHHLGRARKDVRMFPEHHRARSAALLDLTRRDVLVALDVRRYDDVVAGVATTAAERGATVVLLTDVSMSPIASTAQVVLPTRVDAPAPFDTTVAQLVVLEALVTGAVAQLGAAAVRRVKAWDALASGPTG